MTSTDAGAPAPEERRHETPTERADRNYDELLQELRVAQTGVQILLAFLLTVAFTPLLHSADHFTQRLFVVVLALAAAASALLMAPVAIHRLVFRKHMKISLVRIASRLATAGMAVLAFAITGAVLLAAYQVLPRSDALLLGGGCLVLYLALWGGLPLWLRSRAGEGARHD